MLALAFTMSGLALGVRAGGSRARLHGAVLLFVLAMYTKQTSVAAPAALVCALLLTDRRRAVEVIGSGLVMSLLLLGLAQWLTDGGFLRHVIGYNVNRFEMSRLLLLAAQIPLHFPILFAIMTGFFIWNQESQQIRSTTSGTNPLSVALFHFCFCTILLVLIGKSGSSINYLLEWCCAASVLLGLSVSEAIRLAVVPSHSMIGGPVGAILVSAMLATQSLILPSAREVLINSPQIMDQAKESLIRLVRDAQLRRSQTTWSSSCVAVTPCHGNPPYLRNSQVSVAGTKP